MANFLYYAVKCGFIPGVFKTWREAQRQIQGYRCAVHKGFDNLADAEAFAGAPLAVDPVTDPFVVIHDGRAIQRVALTDVRREALEKTGVVFRTT